MQAMWGRGAREKTVRDRTVQGRGQPRFSQMEYYKGPSVQGWGGGG